MHRQPTTTCQQNFRSREKKPDYQCLTEKRIHGFQPTDHEEPSFWLNNKNIKSIASLKYFWKFNHQTSRHGPRDHMQDWSCRGVFNIMKINLVSAVTTWTVSFAKGYYMGPPFCDAWKPFRCVYAFKRMFRISWVDKVSSSELLSIAHTRSRQSSTKRSHQPTTIP